MTTYDPQRCADIIRKQAKDFYPQIALILGSGLSGIAEHCSDKTVIPYQDLPGFPASNIVGHSGQLTLGKFAGQDIICCQGRSHRYEGPQSHEIVKNYIRTFKLLGCHSLIITNAAGSLLDEMPPGSLMLLRDHINFQIDNPLTGVNDDEFGPRFPPLDAAYYPEYIDSFKQVAKKKSIQLHEGVYISVMGPCYETGAEIRAFKILGADAVGMSTVPEVIVANHCGMKVSAISVITNYATGLNTEIHDHEAVVEMAQRAAADLELLLTSFLGSMP